MVSGIRTAITAENLWLQAEQTAGKQLNLHVSEGGEERFQDVKASMSVLLGFNKAGLAEMAGDRSAAWTVSPTISASRSLGLGMRGGSTAWSQKVDAIDAETVPSSHSAPGR